MISETEDADKSDPEKIVSPRTGPFKELSWLQEDY